MKKIDLSLERIAASGPHGTGKTTLMNSLAAHFNLPFHKSPGRAIHEEFNTTPGRAHTLDYATQQEIQERIENRIIADSKKPGLFDRTIVDAVAMNLTKKLYGDDWLIPMSLLKPEYTRNRYSLVFLFPPYRAAEYDGMRELDNGQRLVLYHTIRGLWQDHGHIATFLRTVPNTNAQGVFEYAVNEINMLLSG